MAGYGKHTGAMKDCVILVTLFTLTFRRPPIYNLLSYESVARAGGRICARIKGRAGGRTSGWLVAF